MFCWPCHVPCRALPCAKKEWIGQVWRIWMDNKWIMNGWWTMMDAGCGMMDVDVHRHCTQQVSLTWPKRFGSHSASSDSAIMRMSCQPRKKMPECQTQKCRSQWFWTNLHQIVISRFKAWHDSICFMSHAYLIKAFRRGFMCKGSAAEPEGPLGGTGLHRLLHEWVWGSQRHWNITKYL